MNFPAILVIVMGFGIIASVQFLIAVHSNSPSMINDSLPPINSCLFGLSVALVRRLRGERGAQDSPSDLQLLPTKERGHHITLHCGSHRILSSNCWSSPDRFVDLVARR
eukprot:Protomagalhaensia_sp_Gyna_25__1680@NODE_1876_length_1457_cov_5_413963_g1543_i0_p1_GENE_NODE_1876_length_1457_cov_5_413963_g1543_i0NODE_1876_length_1457_cov_5_413963_g1543_i0_p1_ORF_typecomplete_len109_score4_70_NODE_1876_length_1457_cov_5_413963_g1543_i0352678